MCALLSQAPWIIPWRSIRPPRTNIRKTCSFSHRGLECRSRKSGDTWRYSKFGLGVQNEAGQRLIEFCWELTGHSKQQHKRQLQQHKRHKRQLYPWASLDGQNWNHWLYSLQPKMEKLYIVSKHKTMSWQWLRSWTPHCKIQTYIEESRKNH